MEQRVNQNLNLQNQRKQNKNNVAKKQRTGRWAQRQIYLFQCLLQKYGKNWKKIHQHLKTRSLSQIRSHAQKFFQKIGPKQTQKYQKRAKLLQAYQILELQKKIVQPQNGAFQRNNDNIKLEQQIQVTLEEGSKLNEIKIQSSLKDKTQLNLQAPENNINYCFQNIYTSPQNIINYFQMMNYTFYNPIFSSLPYNHLYVGTSYKNFEITAQKLEQDINKQIKNSNN